MLTGCDMNTTPRVRYDSCGQAQDAAARFNHSDRARSAKIVIGNAECFTSQEVIDARLYLNR